MDLDEAIRICQTIGECEVGTIRKKAILRLIDEAKLSKNYRKNIAINDKEKQNWYKVVSKCELFVLFISLWGLVVTQVPFYIGERMKKVPFEDKIISKVIRVEADLTYDRDVKYYCKKCKFYENKCTLNRIIRICRKKRLRNVPIQEDERR